jgi:hypothetical protein
VRHRGAVAFIALAACSAASSAAARGWRQRWSATGDELDDQLLGDRHVAEPASQTTLAITIDAAVEAVWPWVVQLGADRGGFYSYDWLENLFGLDIHSSAVIVPQWQTRAVGDVVAANRAGTGGWYVVEVCPNDTLALKVANLDQGRPLRRDEGLKWEFLWTFALRRLADGRCRLLIRERVAFASPITRWLMAPIGLISFVMTRKMMLGIRQRAETAATPAWASRDS